MARHAKAPATGPLAWGPRSEMRTAHLIGRTFRCGMLARQSGDRAAWAYAWQEFAGAGSPGHADILVEKLGSFVNRVASSAARRIEVLPKGCPGLCRDECLAVSIVAASQLGACPALKACAFALLESSNVAPCLDAASEFGTSLRDQGHVLSPDVICNALAFLPGPIARTTPDA